METRVSGSSLGWKMYLVCDLGASTADWGLYNPRTKGIISPKEPLALTAESFADMLENEVCQWIETTTEQKITATCISVAGRVVNDQVRLTNGERWSVKLDEVSEILSARGHSPKVHLLNDFEALSMGIAAMIEDESFRDSYDSIYGRFRHYAPGRRILVCGPGTGLGVSLLITGADENDPPLVLSSEGGHHSLAPETNEQQDFFNHVKNTNARVSYEDALSKEGLRNLYNYFRKVSQNLDQVFDISPYDIVARAGPNSDVSASDALSLFCEFLANFCGNLSLTFNVDRAVFLWGGVLKVMPEPLLKSRFQKQFGERAMHSDTVREVPVLLLKNKDIPLMGCALRCQHG